MKFLRRSLLLTVATLALSQTPDLPAEQGCVLPKSPGVFDLWNNLACEGNQWLRLRRTAQDAPGTYDWGQRKQWQRFMKAVHELDVLVKNE